MRERVCYLLHALGHTGGFLVLYRFMDELARLGYEVIAVTPRERIAWHAKRSEEVVRVLSRSNWSGIRSALGRVRVLRQLRARLPGRPPIEQVRWLTERLLRQWVPSDFTIATFCTTAFAAYALSDRTTAVYHMQHYEEVFFDDDTWRKIVRITYTLPVELVANSSWLRERIRRWFGRDAHLLLPGIDAEVFAPRTDVLRKYESPGPFTVLSYYSPVRFKAWPDAVRAMELVFSRLGVERVAWKVFGGTPPHRPRVPVTFLGRLFGVDLAEAYRRAHVVMVPSWYESFPLPPLEAMAAGTAVVTTPIGTEDYVEDGRNALVVPPRDPQALAEAIICLFRRPDYAARLAQAGMETAGRFSWKGAAERLQDILRVARSSPLQQHRREITKLLSPSWMPEQGDGVGMLRSRAPE